MLEALVGTNWRRTAHAAAESFREAIAGDPEESAAPSRSRRGRMPRAPRRQAKEARDYALAGSE
jgi:hypothetical protein